MPDSYGKRRRDETKAKKAAARDARRVARTKRRAQGGSAEPDRGAPVGPQASSEPDPATTPAMPGLPGGSEPTPVA
jgi:hypothetical protein